MIEGVESVFLPGNVAGLATITELAGLGARISIDDYGSGYSNIRLVRELSPDYIKLDRTFLAPDSGDEQGATIDADTALMRSATTWAPRA